MSNESERHSHGAPDGLEGVGAATPRKAWETPKVIIGAAEDAQHTNAANSDAPGNTS